MEWMLALAAGGGLVLGGRYWLDRRRARGEDDDELAGVRVLADEDVTLLGEQLQRLDGAVRDLDVDGRSDYQRALDAYESAQRAVPMMRGVDEISTVTDTLSNGRFAVACVQARLDGHPLPEFRVPCFFNPQHGPSAADVRWTAPGRGTRTVPACAQDAARVRRGEAPEVRKVRIGSRMVPYWEAGAAYLPYGQGYFVGGMVPGVVGLDWAFNPPPVEHGFAGGHDGGGFDLGGGLGDGGGFDGGGGGGGDGGS
jgi:uncharacterized membrane protein YgcG